jgi:prephenate dehydrogenase
MKPLFAKVGVFGVGLLGGSVALGLKERFLAEEVHVYDPDPLALEKALFLGVADRAHREIGPWVGELSLGILAAPVGALKALGQAIAPHAHPESLWTDVGSVKAKVVEALENLLPHFLGGHPMAGSERAGVENAHAELLENAVWVLTPTHRTTPRAREGIRRLVEALGAYPLEVPPRLHDELVARISHLPYLLAVALNRMVAQSRDKDLLMFLAAGGFRDLTRVASGSPRMSRDMVVENKEALKGAIEELREVLLELEGLLESPEALLEAAEEAKRTRDSLPIVRRSLLPEMHDLSVQVPDRPGEIARIATALGEAGVNIKDIEVLTIREEAGALRLGFATREERERAREVLKEAGYRVR